MGVQAMMRGQAWPLGVFPLGNARRDWADNYIRTALSLYGCQLWADGRDITLADGASVETWPARIGTSPTQSTPGARPTFNQALGSVEFAGVDDALATAIDLSSTKGATVYIVARLDSTATTTVLWEYSAQYDINDALVCGVDSSARFWTGMGSGGAGLSYRNSTATAPTTKAVFAARYDRDTNPDTLTQHTVFDHVYAENTAFDSEKDGDKTNNFGAYDSWLGARNNGAGRWLNGGMYEALIVPSYVPDAVHKMIIYALGVKGGLL